MTLMLELHRRAGERFAVTPLEVGDVYHHYEDEEFGFRPLYRQATFFIPLGPARIWLAHEYDRRDCEPTLDLRLWSHDTQWHIIPSAKLREQMRRLGIEYLGRWTKRWAVREPHSALVDGVLDTLACLSMMTFDVLRTSSLPEGVMWPDVWLREVIHSSR